MRVTVLILLFITAPLTALSQTADNPTFSGEASLLSNFVWHGLTQTRDNPAVQSSFVYHLAPIFKVGLWGSNVSYDNSDSNALLKINADLMLKFSPNFTLTIKYSDNKYFEPGNRDGNTLTFDFVTFEHNFGLEQESNWIGTSTKARYFYYGFTNDVFGDAKWENRFGHTMFESPGLDNYFDLRTSLGTKRGFIFWAATVTLLTSKQQFGDSANYFFIVSGTAKF
jgi:uncharacterized protein (TIGR02001 family)